MADTRRFLTGVCTASDSFIDLDSLVAEPEQRASLGAAGSVPTLPAELRASNHDMKFVAAFVVDTNGTVRPATTAIMSSTDSALSHWACDVVPRMHFSAARDHGRAVATQVMMPFTFRAAASDSAPVAVGQSTYAASQVDKQMVIVHNVVPEFPETLMKDFQRGEVVARFVVDTTGRADMSTFQVISSTDPRFVQSVRDAVSLTRYLPAEIGGRRVREVVQVPFIFSFRTAKPYMP